uniref:Putative secreted protein n=1 Tax=Amblyomma parvum TaxID=251391 RepID=A0A023G082_AMBPA
MCVCVCLLSFFFFCITFFPDSVSWLKKGLGAGFALSVPEYSNIHSRDSVVLGTRVKYVRSGVCLIKENRALCHLSRH